jgi:hypothetical protein
MNSAQRTDDRMDKYHQRWRKYVDIEYTYL